MSWTHCGILAIGVANPERMTAERRKRKARLVSSVEEAAKRIVQLVNHKRLSQRMGRNARETVRKNFLMTRLLEQYLDLFKSFRINFELVPFQK